MPGLWKVRPWFAVFLGVMMGTAMLPARQTPGDGSTAAPAFRIQSPAASRQRATTPRPIPPEQLITIAWYVNEIENAAIDICVRSREQCATIIGNMKVTADELPRPMQCRYGCPPGICGPDCIPPPPTRRVPFSDPIPAELHLMAVRWYANAIENAAVEYTTEASWPRIHDALKGRLTALRDVADRIR